MRTKFRTTVLWVIMLLGTWLSIEVISLIAYRIINPSHFSYAKALSKLNASILSASPTRPLGGLSELKWEGGLVEVLHPYFGFVADPHQNNSELQVSDFGFLHSDNASPIVKRSPGKVIVGLFGGSFSRLCYFSLKSVLDRHSAALGKDFIVINFASDGYKQPQQLMVLNYLLALGAEFDIVINVDGFTEVALPPSENIPNNVNPFFPRRWNRRTATAISPAILRLVGYAETTKDSKEKWAQMCKNGHLYISPTLFLLWQYWDNRVSRTIYETIQKIITEGAQSQSYTMCGPTYAYKNEEELYSDLAEVWKRCSSQMKSLCDANGAKYYHFLHPNQYVEGSKPMTEEERRQALNKKSRFADPAAKGYPFLVKAGKELQVADVKFSDLTMIYSEHRELLYIDDCCHTNREGSDIIAERIYETIYGK
jgi:hypothetical protein